MIGKAIPETLHHELGRSVKRSIRNSVEPNQVDPALKSHKETDKSVGVALVVIQAGEHDVLETYSPLTCEIIFLQ